MAEPALHAIARGHAPPDPASQQQAGSPGEKECLRPREVAALLGVDHRRVLAWIKSGELPASDLSSPESSRPAYRVKRSDLDAFLQRRRVQQPKQNGQRRKREPVGEFF